MSSEDSTKPPASEPSFDPGASAKAKSPKPKTKLPKAKLGKGRSATVKFFILAFLSLLMMIPFQVVTNLIGEREDRQAEAVQDVSSSWGQAQELIGPILILPYEYEEEITQTKKSRRTDGEKVFKTRTNYIKLSPKNLNIKGNLAPETRHRGIYDIVVYRASVNLQGHFEIPVEELEREKENILWDKAQISLGLSDLKGLKQNPDITVDGKTYELKKDSTHLDIAYQSKKNGFHADIGALQPDATGSSDKLIVPFETKLHFNGSQDLSIVPAGDTQIQLAANWHSPSFSGSYLPSSHEIKTDAFNAQWDISALEGPLKDYWINHSEVSYQQGESAVKLSLLNPIDFYSLSSRSIKYGILFILFTFGTFFLFEVTSKARYHPIQYSLVGLALSLFYLLLLSLAEHIGFLAAYGIASLAVIGQVSAYTYFISAPTLRTFRAAITAVVLAALYLFIYTLLQMEDFALLVGSIGLFIALGVVMFVTRNINWYQDDEPVEAAETEAKAD